MRQLKLTTLAALMILAITAMAYAATATAALPEILPTPTAEKPIKFEDKGGAGILRTLAKTKVECGKNTSKGSATSAKLGKETILFEECKSSGFKCTGAGQEEGKIKFEGEFHFWYADLGESKKAPAFVVLVPSLVEFKCTSLVTIDVQAKGCIAGLVLTESLNKLVEKALVSFLESGKETGDPDMKSVINDAGTLIPCELLTAVNGGKPESSSIKQEEEELFNFSSKTVLLDA